MKAVRISHRAFRPTSTCLCHPIRLSILQNTTRLYSSNARVSASPFSTISFRTSYRSSVRRTLNKRFSSAKPPFNPTPNLNSPEPSLSISQRLRKLSREYGWSAVGVYFLLSALDFPFCFLAVRWLGTERIGRWEHAVMEWFWRIVPYPLPTTEEARGTELQTAGKKLEGYGMIAQNGDEVGLPGYDHGVAEAEKRNASEDASIWTQLALAYAIHKSFIFVRVPLTAAVLPKVVKTLRGWGWDIGKRRPKGVKGIKNS